METPRQYSNQQTPESKNGFIGIGGFVIELVKVFILAFVIIVPVRMFLFQPFFVQGASMEPTFEDGQYLIINELGYKTTNVGLGEQVLFTVASFKDLKRDDVIVFRFPKNPRQFFIKRVIGLPGERIEIKNNKVFIYNADNSGGLELDESGYLSPGTITPGNIDVTLDIEEYFVMGDNRRFSSDSRSWGALEEKEVIGKVLLRAWPLGEAKLF